VRSYFHNAICILLLVCSESQPDDDCMGLKHVAVWILYKVVFDGSLFILHSVLFIRFGSNMIIYIACYFCICKCYPNITQVIIAGTLSLLFLIMIFFWVDVSSFKYKIDSTVEGYVNCAFLCSFQKFLLIV